jgi:exodeoxyribonuclease VII large subunit
VTSASGAAIRDILTVIQRRFDRVHIIVRPVRVQGEGAAKEITEGIADLNRFSSLTEENTIDVLIVGRGGGSLEDLWAFNEEPVARAIFRSAIPVVSAVGHEIDFTIADFVADVRAATPSAAAELVVPRLDELEDSLSDLGNRLVSALRNKAEQVRQQLDLALRSHGLRAPAERVRQWQQRVDEMAQRLILAVSRQTQSKRERLASLSGQVESLSPLKVLARGYSITTKGESPQIIKDARAVRPGEVIATRLHRGRLVSRVEATET